MSDMMTARNMTGFLVGLFAVASLATPVQAQDADARWTPFVGCWEAVGAEDEIGLLCFTPANGGVALQNLVGGELVSTEQLVADGAQRPVTAEGCEGWETVEFSEDGRRAFTTTEFLCGTEEPRSGSGVMTFVAPNRWADVRALEVDGEPFAWVQEYQLASVDRLAEDGVSDPAAGLDMAVRAGRMAAASPITLDDVIEGSARMDDKAVETWIVVQGDRFDASAQDLLALSEAGASDEIIDAVVAVSNPERFMVAAGAIEEYEDDYAGPTHYRGYMGFNPFYGSSWGLGYNAYGYSPFGYGYSPYGYRPYGYAGGYGYGYGGGYGYGYYGGRGGVVIIDRREAGGGAVYKDRGYSQGSAGTSGTARRRGGAQPQYSGGARSSAGSAGSSGSRGSTPRRAVRRRPSGGSSSLSSAPRVSRPRVVPSARRAPSRPSASGRSVRPRGSSQPSARSRPSRPAASARPSGASRTRPSGSSARPVRRPNGR